MIHTTRRAVLKGLAGAGGAALVTGSPFVNRLVRGEQPIKVGVVVPQTGPMPLEAQEMLAATQIAIEDINGEGGVPGRKVETVIRDSEFKLCLRLQRGHGVGGQRLRIMSRCRAYGRGDRRRMALMSPSLLDRKEWQGMSLCRSVPGLAIPRGESRSSGVMSTARAESVVPTAIAVPRPTPSWQDRTDPYILDGAERSRA